MLQKTTILFTTFIFAVVSVLAQSNAYAQSSKSGDNIAMLPTEAQPLTPEDYTAAMLSSSLSVEQPSAASFTLHRQDASILLHLKTHQNQVVVHITNAVGNVVQILSEENISGGFYELPILNKQTKPGIYVVKLIINEQVVTFQTVQ